MRRQQLIAVLFFGGILSVSLFIYNKSLVKDQIVNNDQKFYSNLLPESSSNEVHHGSYYSYSFLKEHGLSEWTIYLSTRARLLESSVVNRTSNFKQNPNVISSISSEDYRNSGYVIAHLVPIDDMSFNSIAMNESFYYTNTTPQPPSLNKGIWKKLEDKVREWTIEYDSLIIITGCVFKDSLNYTTPKIGKVPVPAFYYKIIIDMQRMSSIAFAIPNYPKENELISYVYSIPDLEKVTGKDFLYKLPDSIETVLEYKEQELAIQEEGSSKVVIEGDDESQEIRSYLIEPNKSDYKSKTDLSETDLIKITTIAADTFFPNSYTYRYPDGFGRLFRTISNPIFIRVDTSLTRKNKLTAAFNFDPTASMMDLVVSCPKGATTLYKEAYGRYSALYTIKVFSNSYYPEEVLPKHMNNKLDSVTIKVKWRGILLAKKQFLVIDKPPPPQAIMLFVRNGKITKEEMLDAGGIITTSKNGANYMITSYSFSLVSEDNPARTGSANYFPAYDSRFTAELINIINNSNSGDKIVFGNIEAVRIGSQPKKISDSSMGPIERFEHSLWSLEDPPRKIQLDPLVIEIK